MNANGDDREQLSDERALLDRLNRLQVVLPALAQDVAAARREAARLRVENRRLARSLADLARRGATVTIGRAADVGVQRGRASAPRAGADDTTAKDVTTSEPQGPPASRYAARSPEAAGGNTPNQRSLDGH